ncbi:Phakinin [Dissostichus eleginoides]|uniref:Phakinin n=1 Tax=Dissostichus eleginoides TaxID=100907 RepID=A0AAD9B286_DISEL|nr:Phakinin [Dissostichus eleginoides]
MPLPRRRSSFLGAPSCERPPRGVSGTLSGVHGTPCGVYGTPLSVSAPPGLSTRVSRRALGISSVFLQGLRSSAAPVMPGGSGGPYGGSGGSCGGGAGLNGCLMEYRDKVRALETLNLQLEDGIRLALDRKTCSAGAWEEKRREWEEVYRQPVPRPEQPVPRPEQPVPRPEQPVPRPEQPVPRPEQLVPRPEQPVPRPEQPVPRPEQLLESL